MQEEKRIRCPACGAHNHGVQTHCLLCRAELKLESASEASPVTPEPQFCTNCGAPLKAGQNFCTECGIKR